MVNNEQTGQGIDNLEHPATRSYIPHTDLVDISKDSDSRFIDDETLQKIQESSNRRSDPTWRRADRQTSPLSKVVTNDTTDDKDISMSEKVKSHDIIEEYYGNNHFTRQEKYSDLKVEQESASSHKKKKKSFFRRIFFCKCSKKDHGDEQTKTFEHSSPEADKDNIEQNMIKALNSPEKKPEIVEEQKPAPNAFIVMENMPSNVNQSSESENDEHDIHEETVDEARLKRWIIKLKKLAKKQRQEKIALKEALDHARKELKESENKSKMNEESSSRDTIDELDRIYAIILESYLQGDDTKTLDQIREMPKPDRIMLVSKWIQDGGKSLSNPKLLEQMINAYKGVCPNEEWLMETQWNKIKSLSENEHPGLDPRIIDAVAKQEYDQMCSNVYIPGPIRETVAYELMHITRKKLLLKSYLSQIKKSKIFEDKEYKELIQEVELISNENEKYRENLSALV